MVLDRHRGGDDGGSIHAHDFSAYGYHNSITGPDIYRAVDIFLGRCCACAIGADSTAASSSLI